MFGGFYLSGDYDESAGFKDKTVSLIKMIGCKVVDFIGVTIPAGIMMLLFVILPTILMISAVSVMQMPGKDFYDIRWPNVYMALANTNQYLHRLTKQYQLMNLYYSYSPPNAS